MKKKVLSLVFAVMCMCLFGTVSANAMTRDAAVNWAKAQIGTAYDVDGLYGYQCSDFGTAYINYLITGNAYSGTYTTYMGYNYFNLSYPSGWQRIENTADFVPESGDILCFAGNSSNSAGHVAVAIEGCTVSVMYGVGQNGIANGGNGEAVKTETLQYYGGWGNFQGVIRPKWDDNSLGNPVNVGDDFYGIILHKASWKPITYCDDEFIRLYTELGKANQVWKFTRQSDGSYVISAASNGNALEIYLGNIENETPLAAKGLDWGGAYQRWFIYEYNGGYVFKSKHFSEQNKVMDNRSNLENDNNTIQIYDWNKSDAQIFSIYSANDVQLTSPTLNAKTNQSTGETIFTWNEVYGELRYDLKIWNNQLYEDDAYHIEWDATNGYKLQLPPGKYQAYVDATNYFECKKSNTVTINVESNSNISAPIAQTTVKKSGSNYTVTTKAYNNITSGTVIAVGYKNGKVIDTKTTAYSSSGCPLTLKGDIDTIKVMVWNSLSSLKPLCKAEVIPSSEFITE